MKSNVKLKVKNKIILSIGMIVKNEEKHLDKCLSALQKLRDNISSELIIVDTGSTDKTKEIAIRYTDKVYDFEWINDFSAARNHGLEKAVGEWFMFVDADEYLDEDCEEMIKFFNMPEVHSKYNSASFMIKNYGSYDKKATNVFLAPRIVRLSEGVKFSNPIHEYIPQPLPHGFFTTIFHHYGYVYGSKKDRNKKIKRNLEPILQEYEENPTELRSLAQLCDACSGSDMFKTFESKEKIYLEYLDNARKKITDAYTPGAYTKAATFYINNEKYKAAIEITDEYLNIEYAKRTVTIVTIYYLRIFAFLNIYDYQNAFDSIEKYFEYYNEYKKDKLDMVELRFSVLSGLTEIDYDEQLMNGARCLNNLERYDEALEYLDKIDISEMSFAHLKLFLNVVRDLISKTKKYLYVAKCYKKIIVLNDDDKTGLILFLMEQYYMGHRDEREDFVNTIIESGVDGTYIELMKIIKDDNDGIDIIDRLTEFLNSVTCWEDGYSEAVYIAMKNNIDLTEVISKMRHNVLKDVITIISDGHYKYAETALNYCQSLEFSDSIKKMLWSVSALEAAVYKSNELDYSQKYELYDLFIYYLSDYIFNIYNPELLNTEDVDVLPDLHRFGFYMDLAFNAKKVDNKIAYVRSLKEALSFCEPMKDLVSFYLKEFELELNN